MERSSSSRRHHHNRSDSRNNPSFSSTLLDSIYRSFDDPSSAAAATDRRRNSRPPIRCVSDDNIINTVRQNGSFRRKSSVAAEIYSSSSSSDSSYGTGPAGFESADDSRSNLKPIRTSSSAVGSGCTRSDGGERDGGFLKKKKKSRSLKNIYGDLKKSNSQPISPGGRLASFLNSLFTAGNAKKAKIGSGGGDEIRPSSYNSSNCSSASSFSRSCLSKTPSSRGGGGKRSVRFYLVDEESRPCGRRDVEAAESHEELKLREEEDDDAASCASSDLFELDNLSAIGGIERYREELPVYETTHLSANRTAGYYY
ncbi:Protein BIG GRAIN 1-like A [Linum grandiflorum]